MNTRPPLQPPEVPLTFRQELVPHVFRAIRGGWSCALVGLKGVGLSNLLRFVCEPRVVADQLGEGAERTLLIDLESALGFDPEQPFVSIIRQIPRSARSAGWPRAEVAALNHWADQLPASAGAAHAEGLLVEVLAYLCDRQRARLVIVFDEFDAAFVALSGAALLGLRRLRDAHKAGLSFLIGTRVELSELVARHRPADGGAVRFSELFEGHTYPVRPYTPPDALALIARKTFDWDHRLTPEQQDQLYRAAGGHAKLLVTTSFVLYQHRQLPWPDLERRLRADAGVADVCRQVWADLAEDEQAALSDWVAGQRPDVEAPTLARLRLKGLLIGRPDNIFSTLFESFIQSHAGAADVSPAPRRLLTFSRLRDPEESALIRSGDPHA